MQNFLFPSRHGNESCRNFESRFAVQLAKFDSLESSFVPSEPMAAFLPLANADEDSSQRTSTLAAALSNSEPVLPKASLDDFARSMKYETIASVIWNCVKPKSKASSVASDTFVLAGNTETVYKGSSHTPTKSPKPKLSYSEIWREKTTLGLTDVECTDTGMPTIMMTGHFHRVYQVLSCR